MPDTPTNTKIQAKELKYDGQPILVEVSRKALMAKSDSAGNVIVDTYALKTDIKVSATDVEIDW